MTFGMRAARTLARMAAAPQVARSSIRMAPAAVFRPALAARAGAASFSTSLRRLDVNSELVAKLESEIEYEVNASTEAEGAASPYTDHFHTMGFQVEEVPGKEEVVLVKEHGDETIRVSFSVSDIHNAEPANEFDEADQALFDEGAAAKDEKAPADEAEEAEEDLENVSFAARVNVQVKKAGKDGVLHINAVAEDGEFVIDTMPFYAAAEPKPADEDGQYVGPPFSNLDADLQLLVVRYLEERGISTDLALLIPEYIDWKEQREYVQWLKNIKSFVE